RARARRGGTAGRGALDQALQPQEADRPHRRDAGGRAARRGRFRMTLWAAIVAGGSGTRFWPLSTPERPKQLLPLAGDRPLVVQAVERLEGLVPPERILILTGALLAERIAALVPQVPRAQVLVEPRAASTAPALAWAAQWISRRDPGAQMLSLHADWAVGDDRAFRAAARNALGVAAEYDVLVTVGVKPNRNETAYGYLVPGKSLGRPAPHPAGRRPRQCRRGQRDGGRRRAALGDLDGERASRGDRGRRYDRGAGERPHAGDADRSRGPPEGTGAGVVTHALHVLDPEPSPAWAPFAGIRPLSELRVGAALVRESWEAFVGAETTAIFALPHLAGFHEPGGAVG